MTTSGDINRFLEEQKQREEENRRLKEEQKTQKRLKSEQDKQEHRSIKDQKREDAEQIESQKLALTYGLFRDFKPLFQAYPTGIKRLGLALKHRGNNVFSALTVDEPTLFLYSYKTDASRTGGPNFFAAVRRFRMRDHRLKITGNHANKTFNVVEEYKRTVTRNGSQGAVSENYEWEPSSKPVEKSYDETLSFLKEELVSHKERVSTGLLRRFAAVAIPAALVASISMCSSAPAKSAPPVMDLDNQENNKIELKDSVATQPVFQKFNPI